MDNFCRVHVSKMFYHIVKMPFFLNLQTYKRLQKRCNRINLHLIWISPSCAFFLFLALLRWDRWALMYSAETFQRTSRPAARQHKCLFHWWCEGHRKGPWWLHPTRCSEMRACPHETPMRELTLFSLLPPGEQYFLLIQFSGLFRA